MSPNSNSLPKPNLKVKRPDPPTLEVQASYFLIEAIRNKNGSLNKRLPNNRLATIFRGPYGGYCWVINNGKVPIYSDTSYEDEYEAALSLVTFLADEGRGE